MISLLLTLKRLLSALFITIKEPIFKSLGTTLGLILLSGTMFYHQTEGWSWLDSFYFAVVSLIPTSLDTGLIPSTTMSKWFTMMYLIVGIGVMLMLLIMIGRAVINFEATEEANKET